MSLPARVGWVDGWMGCVKLPVAVVIGDPSSFQPHRAASMLTVCLNGDGPSFREASLHRQVKLEHHLATWLSLRGGLTL
jgi:hypothetical protein